MTRYDLDISGSTLVLDYTGQEPSFRAPGHDAPRAAPAYRPAAMDSTDPGACACGVRRDAHEDRGHPFTNNTGSRL